MCTGIIFQINQASKKLRASSFSFLMAGVVLAAFGAANPAQAQSSSQYADEYIDEIIVTTARRREESLQEVPLSISVISGDDLERIGAADIIAIAQSSPNVTLEVSRGTNSTLTAFIRGVGQQDPVAGFESGVGIYVDDIYRHRISENNLATLIFLCW